MNFIAYVQRQIDAILRFVKEFAKAYIDDIVIEAQFFEQHVIRLRQLFDLLLKFNITISLTKIF